MNTDAAALIAEALNVSRQSVTAQTSLMTSPEWDSLAHFRIVLALEERLGRALDPLEITTLADLASVERILGTPHTP